MYKIENLPSLINIGFSGEKNFRKVEIDMTAWMEEMPEGVPSIVHIRPEESASDAYIVNTTFEDNILTWIVSAGDLGSVEGVGTAQVWLEEEENSSIVKRGKSILFATQINGAINDASETPPAAQTAWMEAMTALKVATVNAADDAVSAKTAAQSAQGGAETAEENAEAWAVGQRDGTDVPSTDATYHNNSKYYAEQASGSATSAGSAKTDAEAAKAAAEAAALHYPYVDPDTGKWMVWSPSTGTWVSTGIDAQGPKGQTGAPGPQGPQGYGIPTGGTAGDVIVKRSSTDYDIEWGDDLLHPVIKESFTIQTSDWSLTSPYTYTWLNAGVTASSDVFVEYRTGADDSDSWMIEYEKVTGGVEFTVEDLPTTSIPVMVTIIKANAQAIAQTEDKDVSSDAITGAANVHEALVDLDGRVGNVPSGTDLQSEYTELNSNFTTLSNKITTKSITTGITGVTARKTGNVVMLKIIATAPSSKGWFTIGNLPSELRPAYDFYTSIPLVNTDNSIAQLQITASEGITKVYNPNTTANSVNGAIMYVTES